MLSEKLTLSLTCLLLIFGLAIYVPSAMADHGNFDVGISVSANMEDVSSDDGVQLASGRNRSTTRALTTGLNIELLITTGAVVNLADPEAGVTDADLKERDSALDITDIVIDAYDAQGRSLGVHDNAAEGTALTLEHRDPTNPGREFLLTIGAAELTNAYSQARGGGQQLEIHTLLFSIPAKKMERADIGYVTARRNDPAHAKSENNKRNVYRVDLVDVDEGVAQYNTDVGGADGSTGGTAADEGVPGVVTVDVPNASPGLIVTGDFVVRVILTEEPREKIEDLISANDAKVKVVKGVPLKGAHAEVTTTGRDAQASELTVALAGNYMTMAGIAADATGLPAATGRDNMYHQYFVTVTPNPGLTEKDIVVSIKEFSDKVDPAADTSMYIPLTAHERVTTNLTGAGNTARNARIANESVTVRVTTTAKAEIKSAADAYDARQKNVLDKVTNEIVLGNKTYIPAADEGTETNGYLVLVGKAADAGIQGSDAKTNDKAGPELLYNTHGLGLPFPADDLDNFFRNGGTLMLGYADIPEATGSGHGDSKGATGNDATGYTAADSTAYKKGDLIFNEIMWGLDGNDKKAQYIELKNTTGKAIGIDNKEWVITVGALPTGYAEIDSVGNSSPFWEVPGNGGATTVSQEFPTVIDLVSMSRVAGSADGTLEASWAASIRPSANLSGRRVGTPGAANSYVMPAPPAPAPAPETEPAPMAAPPAEADDIMISEVMVASNGGRLPQWVELANVSGAAVSLSGWSLVVENDAADADVVGGIVEIDLGDTEIGEDQVALVVTKEGRNSGVGMGEGDLRADRIINVQSMVSPDNARYSLISEMGFMLTLMPPQTGAVRMYGDSGGNLDMGWDVPMSEEGRSSLIRREMGEAGEIMGTDVAGWVLASDTTLDGAYRTTYYGSDEDSGTPGYNAGGALPVELSMFSAKRNDAGQVVITWETQSELNNAGFFIKRSQQKNGNFVVVNAAMVAGAGTTAEKQSYTYTDKTAQPNVVYYYQIEDVSLDGNRQTLTRAHRLKGHIGAAGKLTTIWGELKSQE